MKKQAFFLLLVLFAFTGWGIVVYQSARQEQLVRAVRDSVIEEIELRRQVEKDIEHELASKKKAQEFVLQQEYLQEFQDAVSQKIEEYKETTGQLFNEFKLAMEQDLAENLDNFNAQVRLVGEYKKEQQAFRQESLASTAAFENLVKQQLSGISQQLLEERRNISDCVQKLDSYKRELGQYRQEYLELKKQMSLKQELPAQAQ